MVSKSQVDVVSKSQVDVVSLLEDALSHRPQHEATGEVGLQQLDEVSESFEDCVERDDTDALRNRIAALQARQVAPATH